MGGRDGTGWLKASPNTRKVREGGRESTGPLKEYSSRETREGGRGMSWEQKYLSSKIFQVLYNCKWVINGESGELMSLKSSYIFLGLYHLPNTIISAENWLYHLYSYGRVDHKKKKKNCILRNIVEVVSLVFVVYGKGDYKTPKYREKRKGEVFNIQGWVDKNQK